MEQHIELCDVCKNGKMLEHVVSYDVHVFIYF